MTKRGVPEQFWMTDKSPAAMPVLEWRFLSSETLKFEVYYRIIGFYKSRSLIGCFIAGVKLPYF